MKNTEIIKENIKAHLQDALSKENYLQKRPSEVAEPLNAFLDDILDYLLSDLPTFTSGPYGRNKALHPDFLLPQLLKEFSLLRKIVNEEFRMSGQLTHEMRDKIDDAIDSAISLASTEFVAVKQKGTEDALSKAEFSNRNLEQFAGVAAHDLKSPLATISGYLSLLDEELSHIESIQSHDYILIIESAAERMRRLIDRLLEYARLTSKNIVFTKVNLNDVIKIAIQNLHSSIQETKTKLKISSLPTIDGDPELLTQLFQNLFANSIKFRKSGQSLIEVTAEDDKKRHWIFSVRDHGIGFDSSQKENIFDLYTTLHSDKKYSGTGIGLATCKKVVDLHHGKIWANSSPGEGATIYFTLPKADHNN